MKLSKADIDEFKQIALEEEGIVISDQEAAETLSRLVILFERFAIWAAAK